ncbi:phenylglyoxylate dehydrogenase [Syntrophaceticus schinkii]|jgi:phenylglyoxylate dehydrogenase alpha subunit|uniref:Pyruvate synthase subunit porA (Pyruvate:ferredoxin oxidoreductase, alpha subunit) n=1 Tax=Syntrophaceticus schinkii TaxID=499207 RepID=A0A0B7MMQ4_9FIRM|nr:phenylglyoxylate dehydrogenase [Syntrophaceticus schinkii]CEO88997.1 Pyruvate synthase subunit porA (Pyruvate:ferredoxin oxidoreductase, alpha subunit) [Syntrophaceticus schinkii]
MSMVNALTGNEAAAKGAALCKPDVIAAYPITPQSSVVEHLAQMHADGLLKAEMVEVESEHSAMSVVQGAALAGGRTFTATSAQGLALMYEPYFRMSTMRLPMVMAIAGREMTSPETIWAGQQDSVSVRESGWIQFYVEDNQEILDTIIQSYKIAEDNSVLIPVNVCYDGFYLSHLIERVEVPTEELVEQFLPPYCPKHIYFDPERPIAVDPMFDGSMMMKFRHNHLEAMQAALDVIDNVDKEFGSTFGRSYGGLIEEYRMDDAEVVLFSIGSSTGAGKDAVDLYRERGEKVGLIKVRVLRPFPTKRILKALSKSVRAIGVVDRSVSFGWNTGALFQEVMAALGNYGRSLPGISFIGGLGGADITLDHMTAALDAVIALAEKPEYGKSTIWLD